MQDVVVFVFFQIVAKRPAGEFRNRVASDVGAKAAILVLEGVNLVVAVVLGRAAVQQDFAIGLDIVGDVVLALCDDRHALDARRKRRLVLQRMVEVLVSAGVTCERAPDRIRDARGRKDVLIADRIPAGRVDDAALRFRRSARHVAERLKVLGQSARVVVLVTASGCLPRAMAVTARTRVAAIVVGPVVAPDHVIVAGVVIAASVEQVGARPVRLFEDEVLAAVEDIAVAPVELFLLEVVGGDAEIALVEFLAPGAADRQFLSCAHFRVGVGDVEARAGVLLRDDVHHARDGVRAVEGRRAVFQDVDA